MRKGNKMDGARSFAIPSLAISLTCYQLTCYQPHLLSTHLLSTHLLLIHLLSISLAIYFTCYLVHLQLSASLALATLTIRSIWYQA